MARSQAELVAALSINQKPTDVHKYELRKLPVFGWQDAKVNDMSFDWAPPFDPTDPYKSLTKLTFKSGQQQIYIGSVQCHMSDGSKSPLFENPDQEYRYEQTMEFEAKNIKKITTFSSNNGE